jgi:hypothetical protein
MTAPRDAVNAYATPAAFRQALEDRLNEAARSSGRDVTRLRRLVAFERLLARLCAGDHRDSPWVLKGGLALELRLAGACRATRDIDFATVSDAPSGQHVREELMGALTREAEDDYFSFAVAAPHELAADLAGRPGWRFSVEAKIGTRLFASLRVDVVARAEEIDGGVEQLTFPSALSFAGYPPLITVQAVDTNQHAAEKLHALTRAYGDRPNTRVKDLVDLVLLVEPGYIDVQRLAERLLVVFHVRGTHDMPTDLPEPPAAWRDDYAALTRDLDVKARTVEAAMNLIRPLWKACANNDARD